MTRNRATTKAVLEAAFSFSAAAIVGAQAKAGGNAFMGGARTSVGDLTRQA